MRALTLRELATALVSLEERIDLLVEASESGELELLPLVEATAVAAARFARELEGALAGGALDAGGVERPETLRGSRELLARLQGRVDALTRRLAASAAGAFPAAADAAPDTASAPPGRDRSTPLGEDEPDGLLRT